MSKIFSIKKSIDEGFLSRHRIERAQKMMAPFILRRKKDQVLKDLPEKFSHIEYCTATPSQKQLYQSIVSESKATFLKNIHDKLLMEVTT